jgi:hypothetical protein
MMLKLKLAFAIVSSCSQVIHGVGDVLATCETCNSENEDVINDAPYPGETSLLQSRLVVQESAAAKSSETCRASLTRFEALSTQDLRDDVGNDPYFPPNMTSIGHGSDCGDTAAGLSSDCAKYNEWHTFQDYNVACTTGKGDKSGITWTEGSYSCADYEKYSSWCRRYGTDNYRGEGTPNEKCCVCGGGMRSPKPLKIIGPSGVQLSDIEQGDLGTCYVLSAFASLAYAEPQVIEDMFVDRHLWAQNIFRTRWFVNGKESVISVDNMIPGNSGKPFFVQTSPTKEWWPIILEKSWSKIFGSFKTAEGGAWFQAETSITMAPSFRTWHDEISKSDLWKMLIAATSNKYPMKAGTGGSKFAKKYGISSGHAYSLLDAKEVAAGDKHVRLFNPWSSDYYNGSVANADKTDGKFTMLLDEFYEAFTSTSIAQVRSNYVVTSLRVPAGAALSVLSFEMSSAQDFSVALTWPSGRLVKPCATPDPTVTLAVSKAGAGRQGTTYGEISGNHAFALMKGGPGKYNILAGARMDDKSGYIDDVYVTVYAPEAVRLVYSTASPSETAQQLLGFTTAGCLCQKDWGYAGTKCKDYCCNPDNSRTDWCFVQDRSCQGRSWGYCK